MKIEGRTFLISGGASGLGAATATEIVNHGGNVAILDMNEEDGQAFAQSLGPSARFFPCNVLETASVTSAVEGAAALGRVRKEALRRCHPRRGVGLPAAMLGRDNEPLSLDDFDFVLAVNLRGTIDLVRQTLPHLAAQPASDPDGERGVVVMVASAAAFDGQRGQVAYAASKGAVVAMTLPMTRDLARHGIRVATIAPSLFESRMTSVLPDKVRKSLVGATEFPRRPGQPEEFAALVRHVVENVMLNGTVLRLDGGMRMPSKMYRYAQTTEPGHGKGLARKTRGKASLPEASLDGSIIAGDASGERQHKGDAVFSGAVGTNLRAGRLVSRASNGY
ncbi:3-hydroxyacyl-CoA dehydrogenase type-2 [Verticillium alfalfae VaMs.102]|uniref:3-hydroxyacyl-CoA dehydrogenase type-2 n=1 Tax=Verticillium alfalfae (strain VaMs.102 / ATCC MYA-4576 / FGSC 10136) TaxID=526221 RepID=C9SYB7_VERA1|nr:3-hydroxyacyl-CoA dehydrogenase type-2 [Verticillium alfalfae VaMs.102]EEY23782.1 3-hydroxyacyl-CoA dehydrogenase type-2 [Verticillium alfalfae VaMs.102]